MSRIPLPLPFGQSLMSGLTTGANTAFEANQANIARQQLAMQQQMNPMRMAYLQSLINASKQTLPLTLEDLKSQIDQRKQLTPAQVKTANANAALATINAQLAKNKIAAWQQFSNGNNSSPSPSPSPTPSSGFTGNNPNLSSINQPPSDIALPQYQQPQQQSVANSSQVQPSTVSPTQQQTQPTSQVEAPQYYGEISRWTPWQYARAKTLQKMGMPVVIPPDVQNDADRQTALVNAMAKSQADINTQQATSQLEVSKKNQEEENSANIKRVQSLQDSLPMLNDMLHRANEAVKILVSDPDIQGPGLLGISNLGGPDYRARNETDPKKLEDMQTLKNFYADMQALKGKQFSGSRVLASGLKLAGLSKTSLSDKQPAALKTVLNFINSMTHPYQQELKFYNQQGGTPLKLPYDDPSLNMEPISKIHPLPNGQFAYLRGGKWFNQ